MLLQQKIREDMVSAMKAKENERVMTLKGLVAAFTNELVALGRVPQEVLSDEETLAVVKRAAKQRMDSIEQFQSGGRKDLAEAEKIELEFIKIYLPEMLSEEEILKVAKKKKEELAITDKLKAGILIGAVMKETKAQADGAAVKKIVETLLE